FIQGNKLLFNFENEDVLYKGRKVTSEMCICSLSTRKEAEPTNPHDFIEQQLDRFHKIKGPTEIVEHKIRLSAPTLIKQRYRPQNPAMQKVLYQELLNQQAVHGVTLSFPHKRKM